jgi:hypothetical protein
LIPGLGNTHGLTNDEMILPDAMDVQDRRIVRSEVDKRHWHKEGKHYGCCGNGSQTFVAGYVPVVITEREAGLPLDHRIHQ